MFRFLLECEQKSEDMIDILQHIQVFTKIRRRKGVSFIWGGYQSMRERDSAAQEAKLQSSTVMGKLKGIIPKSEDWHTLVFYIRCTCGWRETGMKLLLLNNTTTHFSHKPYLSLKLYFN